MAAQLKSLIFMALTALVVGLCFAAGRDIWDDRVAESFYRREISRAKVLGTVQSPPEIRVLSSKLQPTTEGLIVSGTLKNSSELTWFDPVVEVTIKVEDVQVGRCYNLQNFSIHPSEEQSFLVRCKEILGEKLPSKISHSAAVQQASFDKSAKGSN